MGDKFTMSTGQAHELAMAFGRNGWTNADVKKLSGGDLLARLLPIVKGQAEIAAPWPVDPIFKVTVDYGLPLAEMIKAGHYDWVNDDIIPERFPIEGEGKVEREIVVVFMDAMMPTDKVLADLGRRGLRPAKIEELLALGAAHPDLQKEFPIVALGAPWVDPLGRHTFACLLWSSDCSGRWLNLDWAGVDGWGDIDGDWDGLSCGFVALRK